MIKSVDEEFGSQDDESPESDESPRLTGTLYITSAGAESLRAEFKRLLTDERPKVTAEVSAAAALGDRSENAEYIYGKKRLREIDKRLHYLQKRLEKLTVVDVSAQRGLKKVYFGATVTLENEDDGSRVTYRLVGADETCLKSGKISVDSPVGKALLGRETGESVTVSRPRGELDFVVLSIIYE
jgi:transcription elongation factor GreB